VLRVREGISGRLLPVVGAGGAPPPLSARDGCGRHATNGTVARYRTREGKGGADRAVAVTRREEAERGLDVRTSRPAAMRSGGGAGDEGTVVTPRARGCAGRWMRRSYRSGSFCALLLLGSGVFPLFCVVGNVALLCSVGDGLSVVGCEPVRLVSMDALFRFYSRIIIIM
jgi:hypothetical protein